MSEEYREYVRWKMRQQRIVPKEVRHGRWEMSVRNIHGQIIPFIACSICGKNANDKYPYCPFCGASMDEVEDE